MPNVTLDQSQAAFRERPCKPTAASYMATLMQYAADDMIGDDTWLNGLSEILDYLEK